MNPKLVLACAIALAFGIEPTLQSQSAAQRFALDSMASTYPFVMRLQGTMEVRDDDILVRVTSGLVRSAIPEDIGEEGTVKDVQIIFGLGEVVPEGWTLESLTPSQPVVAVLKVGEQKEVPEMVFRISGTKEIALEERWLAAALTVTQRLPGVPAGLLSSYACSEANLLGPTEASRARAEAMRRDYSRIC